MDPQPMRKVRNLKRLAGRVACRSTVRWSRLWAFLGFCLLAAVVCGPAVDLPRAQGAGAVVGSVPSARAPTRIPQRIAFDQPSDTAVSQPVRLTASSVTTTTPAEGTGLLVSFRSDPPDVCTVSGTAATPTAVGACTITASQGGSDRYAAARPVPRSFQAHTGIRRQAITFNQPPDVLAAAVVTSRSAGHSEVMDWPVLASLPQNERQKLVAGLRRQIYRRDEVIFHQGDPADTLHLIAAGHVSVRRTLPGGEFVVVAILGPGNTFGEFALVGDAHRRGATIVALEPSETLTLGRHAFERLRTSYPGIDRFLVELLSARLEKVNTNLLEALYVPAERRVMRRLLDLCELYEGDDQRIMIPVTQETLASIAGTTRPTANQVLRRLVASEIVVVNRSQITVVNRSGLQHLASGTAPGR